MTHEPTDDDTQLNVEVPWDRLSHDVLLRVVHDFVTRDGTDYGEVEVTLEEKTAQLLYQLKRGNARLLFDAKTESINLVADDSPGKMR